MMCGSFDIFEGGRGIAGYFQMALKSLSRFGRNSFKVLRVMKTLRRVAIGIE